MFSLSRGGRGTVPSKCTDGELRLVNGSVPTEGRLEICFNHAWGNVCSNKGTSDGVLVVACRTLGFFPFGKESVPLGYSLACHLHSMHAMVHMTHLLGFTYLFMHKHSLWHVYVLSGG